MRIRWTIWDWFWLTVTVAVLGVYFYVINGCH